MDFDSVCYISVSLLFCINCTGYVLCKIEDEVMLVGSCVDTSQWVNWLHISVS